MENVKDEGKQIVHGLHVRDGDQEGCETLSRNKITLYEDYSMNSQHWELLSRSNYVMPSLSNVGGVKRKEGPIFASMNECSSPGPGFVSRPSNYQKPNSSSSLMMNKCSRVSYNNGSRDLTVSSLLQTPPNLQLILKKQKLDAFGSSSNETRSCGDQAMGLPVEESSKELKSKIVADDGIPLEEEDSLMLKIGVTPRLSKEPVDRDVTSKSWDDLIKERGITIGDDVKSGKTWDQESPPDQEVFARKLGPRMFLRAKETMSRHQKIYSLQIFELHRLITVQKHISRSPQFLQQNTFHPNKPSINFPPINNLLYVASMDPSPKPKLENPESDECEAEAQALLPLPTTDVVQKGYLTHPLPPKSSPNPPPNPKLAPWRFPVPTGTANQWLVPVRSPSEGLIYKPFPGPYYPNAVAGLSLLEGAISTDHGGGGFCSTDLSHTRSTGASRDPGYYGHTYLQSSYAINPNPELKQVISPAEAQTGGNKSEMQETGTNERLEGDALSLFPTTPSLQAEKKGQRVRAIKVIPHNRKSASASAARIFESIQEERRKHK